MKKSASNAFAFPSLVVFEVDMLLHVIVKRRYSIVQVPQELGYALPALTR